MSKKIAILIPCYNESLTIKKVVNDFKKQLPNDEIYVYDNNSTDDPFNIARSTGAIVRKEYNQGKGNVVRSMFKDINADCYLMVDGDDTYPTKNAKEMCDLILNSNYDMVIGDRLSSTYFNENKRLFHNAGNKLVRFLVNKKCNSNIKDVMTGYRAFSKKLNEFENETEMTIYALNNKMKIIEIPIKYRNRPKGSKSKLKTFKDGIKVLKAIR